MASSSLFFPSFSPKTLSISTTQKPFISLFSAVSLTSSAKCNNRAPTTISFSSHSKPRRCISFLSSPFTCKVSISSEFEQEEDYVNEEERNFTPDLKLFVGNLPFNVDSSDLAELFGRAGEVQMVEVIYDKTTGSSRGFGFVTMSTLKEVNAAAMQFNGYEFHGRPLRVNAGPPPPKDGFSRGPRSGSGSGSGPGPGFNSANRVHVSNLAWGVDDSALESLFSEQGKVMEAKVVFDKESGRSRGFGFVTYGSAREVNNAISSLDGVDLEGRSIRVTMAEARPRRRF